MKIISKSILILILTLGSTATFAQQTITDNNLYSAGHAGGFISGLYDAYYPYKQLEQHGNFGLGAPDHLDGELMMLDGKYYQARYTGATTQLSDAGRTPYATVCFFKADKIYKPGKPLTKAALFSYLDSVLNNQNGMFAIHIKGTFKSVRTRAFPPVLTKPYVPIAAMLDKQAFFTFDNIEGDFIGFKLPGYLEGPAIAGYHFHFLSANKNKGGHVVDCITDNVVIEVEVLNSFTLDVPQTADFNNFNFKKDRSQDIKNVENGKK